MSLTPHKKEKMEKFPAYKKLFLRWKYYRQIRLTTTTGGGESLLVLKATKRQQIYVFLFSGSQFNISFIFSTSERSCTVRPKEMPPVAHLTWQFPRCVWSSLSCTHPDLWNFALKQPCLQGLGLLAQTRLTGPPWWKGLAPAWMCGGWIHTRPQKLRRNPWEDGAIGFQLRTKV